MRHITPLYFMLLIFFSISTSAFAQTGNEKYEKGIIFLKNGDTLEVSIKPEHPERYSKQISVWNDQTMGAKRYTPRELDGFSFQGITYISQKDAEGKQVFMAEIVKGEVSLYEYMYKETTGKKEVVTEYYIKRKNERLVLVPTSKSKFRNEMSYYFADNYNLSQSIDDKMYQYDDIETIVEYYNEEFEAAKRKELAEDPKENDGQKDGEKPSDNGNIPAEEEELITNPTDDYPILRDNTPQKQKKTIGVEVSSMLTYSLYSYPNTLNTLYRVKSGGVGFEVGLGFRASLSKGLTFRTGINIKDKAFKFESNTLQVVDGGGNVVTLQVKEQGRNYYPGIYFNIGQEWKYFMIGGGFNLSFFSGYRGKYSYSGGGFDFSEPNAKTSFMVHELNRPDGSDGHFNMQFDINLTAGARFAIGKQLTLKPVVQYSIPMVSLYNSGILVSGSTGNVELNVSGYAIKIGLIADFGNW